MKAVVIQRGESTPRLIEKPRPTPAENEVLVRTIRVGIDGTDHEVIAKNHGDFPEDDDHLVLGHETIGTVVDPNGNDIDEGQLVVPTVRRPPPGVETNEYFQRGEPDMAPQDAYVERGIVGAHGFMTEYFTTPPDWLVELPSFTADFGFLVEPISNTEKALELAEASRSTFTWNPESAFVLGNGPLGLLTLAMLSNDDRYDDLYALGRRDRPDPTIDIIENLNATYVDSRKIDVSNFTDEHEPVDLVYEATGYAPHAYASIDALSHAGIAVLMGIPQDHTFDIEGGRLHRECVLGNKALIGSVNSHVPHFEAARESLNNIPDWFINDLITGVYSPEEAKKAFERDDKGIKTAIEFYSV